MIITNKRNLQLKNKLLKLNTVILLGIVFTTIQAQTVEDIEGNVYKTVTIGKQVWMAENLKTSKYNNGTSIPLVTRDTEWNRLATPAYCWYRNDQTKFGYIYGALYNWYAINTGSLYPAGWHVTTDAKWTTVFMTLMQIHGLNQLIWENQ